MPHRPASFGMPSPRARGFRSWAEVGWPGTVVAPTYLAWPKHRMINCATRRHRSEGDGHRQVAGDGLLWSTSKSCRPSSRRSATGVRRSNPRTRCKSGRGRGRHEIASPEAMGLVRGAGRRGGAERGIPGSWATARSPTQHLGRAHRDCQAQPSRGRGADNRDSARWSLLRWPFTL